MGVGGYVLCEYEAVKQEFPEFNAVMEALHSSLIAKAEADWAPLKFDREQPLSPRNGMFGETTIIPALFNDITGTRMVTWEQWFNATGSQTIMTGAAPGGTIYEDYKIGLIGLVFLDKAIRISEIKMQIGDKKLPRINIEEAFGYNKPAIVFEQGFILDEETGFDLYAYVLTQGPQRIKLLGFQLNRVKDKLFTNTGSALT